MYIYAMCARCPSRVHVYMNVRTGWTRVCSLSGTHEGPRDTKETEEIKNTPNVTLTQCKSLSFSRASVPTRGPLPQTRSKGEGRGKSPSWGSLCSRRS